MSIDEKARLRRAVSTSLRLASGVLALASVVPAHAQETSASSAPQESTESSETYGLEELVVTARRTEENVQRVPVTVNAFSAESLRESSIVNPRDLQMETPGVFLGGSGSTSNTVYVIRGQAKPLIGVGQPGAITYFAEVPLTTIASSQPQYDISSIQVLKGPQGTLFGRNTTGGAVLIYPQAPTREFGGYVEVSGGNYDYRGVEGALNVPLGEIASLRIAGRMAERDGYVENIGEGNDFDDVDDYSYRVSLLLEPIAGFKNTTTFDFYKSDVTGQAQVFAGFVEGSPFALHPQLQAEFAAQQARGIREVDANYPGFDETEAMGVTNRTEWEAGPVRLVNIFGYRELEWRTQNNFDGLPAIDLFGSGFAGPVLDTYRSNAFRQYTEELQVHGSALDDKLTWLVGGFFLDSKPNGENADRADVFNQTGNAVHTFISEESKAIFANASYDLSNLLEGLKFNVGGRYTWDEIDVCSALDVTAPGTRPTSYGGRLSDCEDGSLLSATQIDAEFSKPTWTVGLDWQINDDLFTYVTSRRGYRAGGVNVPVLGAGLSSLQTFEPETITDVELGLKSSWNVGEVEGRFNVATFYAKAEGVQYNVIGLFTLPGCTAATSFDGDCNPNNDPSSSAATINAGDTSVRGVEASVAIVPMQGLTLTVGGSYIDPKTEEADYGVLAPFVSGSGDDPTEIPFRFVPETTLTAGVRYEFPLGMAGDLVTNVDYYWSDEVIYGIYTADSYDNVNVRVDLNGVAGQPIDVSAFVRNAFDDEWVTTGGAIGAAPGTLSLVYNEPRMYGIQARYRFGN